MDHSAQHPVDRPPRDEAERRPRPARRSRKLVAPLLAGALVAVLAPVSASAAAPERVPAGGPPAGGAQQEPCLDGDGGDGWTATSTKIDPKGGYDAYVGNGYLGARVAPNGTGYAAPGGKTGWPLKTPAYDGAFVSGLYAKGPKDVQGRQAIAAIPTWSTLDVATGGARPDTFSSATAPGRISNYRQSLSLRCGFVRTSLTWTAADGRRTDLVYDVLADRNDAHTGAVRLRMTPHWSGAATVTDGLDGRGARRMAPSAAGGSHKGRTMDVGFRTDGTNTDGTVASTLRTGPGVQAQQPRQEPQKDKLSNRQRVSFPVRSGRSYELTKYVGVDTALTSRSPRAAADAASRRAAARGWDALFARHTAAWQRLWRSDIEVKGQPDMQSWVRSAQYGLLSSTRAGSDNSIGPTGLTSDNYAGEVFWDAETWMYPGLLATHPTLARSIVDYRYKTRAGARANAKKLGYDGLFYPWTSGSKGNLWNECHSWDPPHCKTQNHLMGDISLAAWQYYLATKDTAWLKSRGWPVLKGIAEFWASRATRNADGSYSVKNVAGPDEYSNGVNDGVFTNAGAATALRNATRVAGILGEKAPASWKTIADKLRIPYDSKKKIFEQYAGYKGTTIKQADTVLLMYPLEWPMSKAQAARTLDFYAGHTDPDGPAMTDSVHAIDAAAIGEPGCATYTYLQRAIKPFVRGPFKEFSEARGNKAGATDPHAGKPAQDFLTGKGGFLQTFTNGLTGLRLRENAVHLDPMLPPQLSQGVTLRGLHWQGRTYDIEIGAHQTTVRLTAGAPMKIETPEGDKIVSRGVPAVLKTRRPDQTPTSNAARCTTATATSEEPGLYAGAALDGNTTTAWVPNAATGTLTVDLGRPTLIGQITPHWTATRPKSYNVQVSRDGKHWTGTGYSGRTTARYVRVTVEGDRTPAAGGKPKPHPGITELTVQRLK
ncbi:Trehalose and maltose hydrolase (possible phosphorylase) [Streptomyces sp. 2323.1]|uniref:discoidin domain-containing protein n=1 Tax=Streptomyces sp. 2323.1 TaxID=1938841 RepID=UPI000BB87ED7|nr:discoidin domain-containing protein [Streptomyces sp. 2323.1]SOE13573.1 Trehalose and maltose hydrolase (possible phosphorylase) [Streptomyces sp. 2323.1]